MRDYELVLILNPDLNEEASNGALDRIRAAITNGGGEVGDVNIWGRRRIAFSINGFNYGVYVALNAKMDPSATGELERGLFLSEDVLRHLLVRLEKAPVRQQVQQAGVAQEKEQSNDGGDTE